MKTIIISSRKGGAGKTTLSLNLATEAAQEGHKKVALLDLDPQGSTTFWSALREHCQLGYPNVQKTGTGELKSKLNRLAQHGYDYVFLDMPPTDQKWLKESLGKADLVIVPTRPSPLDIHSATSTLEWAAEAGAKVAWAINAASTSGKSADIVFDLLKATKVPVFKTIVHERGDFVTSLSRGQSVSEFSPASKSAMEMQNLWKEIHKLLNKRN